jgi:hypothetical protein
MAGRNDPSDLEEFYIESRSRRFFRRQFKRVRRLLYFVLFMALLLIAAAPTLVSSNQGRDALLQVVNRLIPGQVSAEAIYLSWFGAQSIVGLELRSPDRRLVGRAAELRVDHGLLRVLSARSDLGRVHLVAPLVSLSVEEDGSSNLGRALGWEIHEGIPSLQDSAPQPAPVQIEGDRLSIHIPVSGQFSVESGQLTLIQPGVERAVLSEIEGRMQFSRRSGPLVVYLKGRSKQGELSGQFDIELLAAGFSDDGRLHLLEQDEGVYHTQEGAAIEARISLSRLPLEALDQLLFLQHPAQRGFLTSALGKQMSMKTLLRIDSEQIEVDLTAQSPTLTAQLKGRTDEGMFHLSEAGMMVLEITPTFFDRLSALFRLPEGLRLMQAADLAIRAEELSFPLLLDGGGLNAVRLDLAMDFEDAELVGDAAFGELELKNTLATLKAEALGRGLELAFRSNMRHNDRLADIGIELKLRDLVGPEGHLDLQGMGGDVAVTAYKVPVLVVDEWLSLKGMLPEALGPVMDLTIGTDIRRTGSVLSVDVQSERLSLTDAKFVISDRATLLEPLRFDYQAQANLLNRFLAEQLDLELTYIAPLQIEINRFSMPFSRQDAFVAELVELDADLRTERIDVAGVDAVDVFELEKFEVALAGDKLSETQLAFKGGLHAPLKNDSVREMLGQRFEIEGSSILAGNDFGSLDLFESSLSLRSDLMEVDVFGSLLNFDELILSQPLEASFTLTPSFYETLRVHPQLPILTEPAFLRMELAPLELSFRSFQLQTQKAELGFVFEKLALRFPDEDQVNHLEQGNLFLGFNGPENRLQMNIDATVSTSDSLGRPLQSGEMTAELAVDGMMQADGSFSRQAAELTLSIEAEELPVSFVEAVSEQPGLHQLFGRYMTGSVSARLPNLAPPQGAASFVLSGQDFKLSGVAGFDERFRLATEDRPFLLHWRITPERYQVFTDLVGRLHEGTEDAIDDLELLQTGELKLRANRVSLPMEWLFPESNSSRQRLSTAQDVAIDMDVSFENLHLRAPRLAQTLRFDRLKGFAVLGDLKERLSLGVTAEGTLEGASGIDPAPSSVVIKGQLWDLAEEEGSSLRLAEASANLEASIKNLPVVLLGDFFTLSPEVHAHLSALFGPTLYASAEVDVERMSGAVEMKFEAPNSKGSVSGELIEGALVLTEPIELQLDVNPNMGRQVLRYFNPLMLSTLSAEEPLYLRIEADGFELPLVPLELDQARFTEATLTLGKLTMGNSGPMGSLIDLLKLSRYSRAGTVEAWFTPFYLAMEGGVLTVKRSDFLLADQFHMATWGKVDIARNRVFVIAGLAEDTLRHALGLKSLPDDYILQVPIEGSIDAPRLSGDKAAREIAKLFAEAFGGERGRIFQGIVEDIDGASQLSIPAPTSDPFPWKHRDPALLGNQQFSREEDHPKDVHYPDEHKEKWMERYDRIQKNRRDFNRFVDKLWR